MINMAFGKSKQTEADRDIARKTKVRRGLRIVRHTNPPADVCAYRSDLETRLPDWVRYHGGEAFDRP
jgi:hypothetical protein